MDKLKIIKIINKLLELYFSGRLNYEIFIQYIDEIKNESEAVDDDAIAYEETNLMLNIFNNCPYYKILNEISTFMNKLESLTSVNIIFRKYLYLIKGYFEDITPRISQRITTEVNAHLYFLAKNFFNDNKINGNLKSNICNLNILFAINTSENFKYIQESFNFQFEKTSLRDEISKINYKVKSNMEKSLIKLFVNYFDEKSLVDFQYYLDDLISKIFATSLEESLDIKILYYDQFDKLNKKIKKEWECKKTEDDEYQLKLDLSQ